MNTHEILETLNNNCYKTNGMMPICAILQKFIVNDDKEGVIEWIGTPQPGVTEEEYHLFCQVLEWAR